MTRTRISTTVDPDLLATARDAVPGANDSSLLEQALRALIATHRAAEIDGSFAAYDRHPLDEPDEWGDLESWRRAAGAS